MERSRKRPAERSHGGVPRKGPMKGPYGGVPWRGLMEGYLEAGAQSRIVVIGTEVEMKQPPLLDSRRTALAAGRERAT